VKVAKCGVSNGTITGDLCWPWRPLLLFKTFLSYIRRLIQRVLFICNMFTSMVISVILRRTSQGHSTTRTLKMRKRGQIAPLLIQTTNRKCCSLWVTYRTEAIPMTLSHRQGHSYGKPFKCDFYSRHTMLARYLLSPRVFPSVCPYVASQSCTKTAKRRIMHTTLHDNPGL